MLVIWVTLLTFLLSTGYFFVAKKFCPSRWNKAWFVTLLSSAPMSFIGIYYLRDLLVLGPFGYAAAMHSQETEMMRLIVAGYMGFMLADLAVDRFVFAYDGRGYELGREHHWFYLGFLMSCLVFQKSGIFCMMAAEEIPTVFLSISRINCDIRFGKRQIVLFFLFRIAFHSIMTWAILPLSSFYFLSGMMIMRQHLKWFAILWKKNGRFSRDFKWVSVNYKLAALTGMCLFWCYLCIVMTKRTNQKLSFYFSATLMWSLSAYLMYYMITVLTGTYTDDFIMDAIEDKNIIYNISWEDPAIEIKALGFKKSEEVILTICSSGDNVLDYLCEDPALVVAADLNVAQLAMLDLKLAGIAAKLPWEDFFALWGQSNWQTFDKYYTNTLREHLRLDSSKDFWDSNGCRLFRNNIMYAGTSGLMAYIVTGALNVFFGFGDYMRRQINPGYDPDTVRWILSWLLENGLAAKFLYAFAPLGGVPSSQAQLVIESAPSFLDYFSKLATQMLWTADNYFYSGYFNGSFTPECCPRYMSRKFYPDLHQRVKNVQMMHATLGEAAATRRDWSVISILDSMDWMSPRMVADCVKSYTENLDRVKGRIFWRSAACHIHSPALSQLNPVRVETLDRVLWYTSQWKVTLTPDFKAEMLMPEIPRKKYDNTLIDDLHVMTAMLLQGLKKTKDTNAFYSSQADVYDGFRESLLPRREEFMSFAVPWTQKVCTWVSVGCGTARDLEYVIDKVRKQKTHVFLVDLSKELLNIAEKRVEACGINDLVTIVCGDFTDVEVRMKLPANVDMVTCSYCLTMIPSWSKALDAMLALVRPGGHVCFVDFTCPKSMTLPQQFYKWWFSNDGVYFNREHLDWLKGHTEEVFYSESTHRVPYMPLWPTHYIFVGRKPVLLN